MNPFSGNFQLLVLHFCCMLATCIAVNCADDREILQEQTKCFRDQGIEFEMQESSEQNTGQQLRNLWMETIIIQKAREFCLRQQAFELALECDMNISMGCIPAENRKLIPDQKQLKLIMPAICDDKQKVNFECVKDKLKSIFECGEPKNLPEGVKLDSTDAMCKHFDTTRECQMHNLKECGCNALRVLDLILRELVQPVTCPPMVAPVKCDDPADFKVGYMKSNSNQLAPHVAFAVFICVLLTVLE